MKTYINEDKSIRLYNADCLEVIDKMIERGIKVDVIITSPPYNIGNMHSNKTQHGTYTNNNMKECDYQEWQIKFLNKCLEILKEDGSIFYNHKVRIKDGKAIHPLEFILKTDCILKQEITWDMGKSANCDKIRFFPFSERIYWLTKSTKTKLKNTKNLSDVWRVVPKHKRKETGHIAVMPEEIVENILESIECKTVFDPFVGSGTTGAVCNRYKKEFIGCEIEEQSFDLAVERLSKKK